jgi:serine/threonine-protein kinase
MGRVYEGRHPQTKARVAIKVLHFHVVRDRIAVERFKREFESSLELNHPYVVKVLEFGDTGDGSQFLTMEYLEGQELGKVLGHGQRLAPARVVRIISQAALALEHAHSFGFIHRDLKPDNIFLCRTPAGDEVRVLDFGSVKLQVETGAKLTAIGTTIGSPFYMSPEQAMGRSDVDQRTDVFALGAILYEMLTDKIAFDATNVAKILMRIMNEMPEPPSQVAPGCPAAFDQVVAKALSKAKDQRYGSVKELAAAVISAYGLAGAVEAWAGRSEAEIAAAIDAVPKPAPRVEERPKPVLAPPPAAVASIDRGDPTVPKMRISRDERSLSTLTHGPNLSAMALIALSVVVAAGLLVLLFR